MPIEMTYETSMNPHTNKKGNLAAALDVPAFESVSPEGIEPSTSGLRVMVTMSDFWRHIYSSAMRQ
jgi:hypothetical protein